MLEVDMHGKMEATADGIFRWDYGQILNVIDTDIADGTEADFYQGDKHEVRYLVDNKAEIPDIMLESTYQILAYLYIRSPSEGETIKVIKIPVKDRPRPYNTDLRDAKGNYPRLLPKAGAAGQYLVKRSDADYDVEWREGGGSSGEDVISDEFIDRLF